MPFIRYFHPLIFTHGHTNTKIKKKFNRRRKPLVKIIFGIEKRKKSFRLNCKYQVKRLKIDFNFILRQNEINCMTAHKTMIKLTKQKKK